MFKKFVVILLIISFIFLFSGCGNDMRLKVKGSSYSKIYTTYGLFNKDDIKSPGVQYKVIWGNVIWGCFLFETIIAPVYFFGFSMLEPVGVK